MRFSALCELALRPLASSSDRTSRDSILAPFVKLKEQVEAADSRIRAAAAQDTAELKAMVDEARKHADEHAAGLGAKSEEVAGQPDRSRWQQVQSDWHEHNKRMRASIDAKKAELDADQAESDAEWAAADAADAIEFASAAIEEAEYAMLDAVLARKDADVRAAAT